MVYDSLPSALTEVRERIASACARSGRDAGQVGIVAVTKTHPASAVSAALAAGLTNIGENRVQELDAKVGELGRDAATWHLIGTLQRNKAKRAVAIADLIHSLDSERLAAKLSSDAVAAATQVRVLAQVNVSGEASKSGFAPEEAVDAIGRIAELPAVRIAGLMTMAPFTDDERAVRSTFAATRELLDVIRGQLPGAVGGELSMGMSNDYEIAVEEGSTLVRLGTILFGERDR